jgi:hypothetical protein
MKKIVSIFFLMITFPIWAEAITSDFTIKLDLVGDATPPTTPILLAVTPISSAQIDIDWSASTDNYILSGYVLLRNGVPIATTTLTNFSDTGLAPITLYNYSVYAFDNFFNLSSTSNVLATSTLAIPSIPDSMTATSSKPTQTTLTLVLQSIDIETKENSANLSWQTNLPSQYRIRWGRTDTYNGGYIFSETYLRTHRTNISDLEPGTIYYYEILGETPAGIVTVIKSGQFQTTTKKQSLAVENVSRLEGVAEGDDVRLSWQLPKSITDIASVRVVRSHLNFPTDVYDGVVVYDGLGSSYLDKKALSINSPEYYTVFVVSTDGTISSGAVVVVFRKEKGADNGLASTSAVIATPSIKLTPDVPLFGLDVNRISIRQLDQVFTFLSDKINLADHAPFVLSLPYDALPRNLKSIIVTLLDPTDHRYSYSFLLRINKDRTAYEATIAPLNVIGVSKIQIEIFDFERMLVGKYSRQLNFVGVEEVQKPVVFPDALVNAWSGLTSLLVPLLVFFGLSSVLIWWGFRWRRQK